jgi:hypothetical protein
MQAFKGIVAKIRLETKADVFLISTSESLRFHGVAT